MRTKQGVSETQQTKDTVGWGMEDRGREEALPPFSIMQQNPGWSQER